MNTEEKLTAFLEEERNTIQKEYNDFIENCGEIGELDFDDILEDSQKRLISFVIDIVGEEIEKKKRTVSSEEPFVPFYKPYGMSEEQYTQEIQHHEQEHSEWQSDCEYNQGLDDIKQILTNLKK